MLSVCHIDRLIKNSKEMNLKMYLKTNLYAFFLLLLFCSFKFVLSKRNLKVTFDYKIKNYVE